MAIDWGALPAGTVIPFPFDTFAGATGASITISGLAVTDIEVYKGTSMTQRASDAGYVLMDTDGIDLDGITGIQGFSIDTGDNTDAGFYTVGSLFWVVVSAITIDGQTVNFVAGTFRLIVAENTTGTPVVDVGRISNDAAAADNAEAFFDGTGYAGTNNVIPTVTTTAAVGTGGITAGSFGAGAIDAAAIAASAIGASEIANDAITAAKIATGAIDADALAADAANEIADALLDRADAIETGITPRGALRLSVASDAGQVAGAATATVTIRDVANSKNRVTATVDASGNRTATAVDVT